MLAVTLLTSPSCLPTNTQVAVEVVGISSSITLLRPPEISVDVNITSARSAKFKALTGDLKIGGEAMPYRLTGLNEGDMLSKGEPVHITILVSPSVTQVAKGSAALLTGGVEVVFDGTLSASKYGIPFSLPVEFSESLSLGSGFSF